MQNLELKHTFRAIDLLVKSQDFGKALDLIMDAVCMIADATNDNSTFSKAKCCEYLFSHLCASISNARTASKLEIHHMQKVFQAVVLLVDKCGCWLEVPSDKVRKGVLAFAQCCEKLLAYSLALEFITLAVALSEMHDEILLLQLLSAFVRVKLICRKQRHACYALIKLRTIIDFFNNVPFAMDRISTSFLLLLQMELSLYDNHGDLLEECEAAIASMFRVALDDTGRALALAHKARHFHCFGMLPETFAAANSALDLIHKMGESEKPVLVYIAEICALIYKFCALTALLRSAESALFNGSEVLFDDEPEHNTAPTIVSTFFGDNSQVPQNCEDMFDCLNLFDVWRNVVKCLAATSGDDNSEILRLWTSQFFRVSVSLMLFCLSLYKLEEAMEICIWLLGAKLFNSVTAAIADDLLAVLCDHPLRLEIFMHLALLLSAQLTVGSQSFDPFMELLLDVFRATVRLGESKIEKASELLRQIKSSEFLKTRSWRSFVVKASSNSLDSCVDLLTEHKEINIHPLYHLTESCRLWKSCLPKASCKPVCPWEFSYLAVSNYLDNVAIMCSVYRHAGLLVEARAYAEEGLKISRQLLLPGRQLMFLNLNFELDVLCGEIAVETYRELRCLLWRTCKVSQTNYQSVVASVGSVNSRRNSSQTEESCSSSTQNSIVEQSRHCLSTEEDSSLQLDTVSPCWHCESEVFEECHSEVVSFINSLFDNVISSKETEHTLLHFHRQFSNFVAASLCFAVTTGSKPEKVAVLEKFVLKYTKFVESSVISIPGLNEFIRTLSESEIYQNLPQNAKRHCATTVSAFLSSFSSKVKWVQLQCFVALDELSFVKTVANEAVGRLNKLDICALYHDDLFRFYAILADAILLRSYLPLKDVLQISSSNSCVDNLAQMLRDSLNISSVDVDAFEVPKKSRNTGRGKKKQNVAIERNNPTQDVMKTVTQLMNFFEDIKQRSIFNYELHRQLAEVLGFVLSVVQPTIAAYYFCEAAAISFRNQFCLRLSERLPDDNIDIFGSTIGRKPVLNSYTELPSIIAECPKNWVFLQLHVLHTAWEKRLVLIRHSTGTTPVIVELGKLGDMAEELEDLREIQVNAGKTAGETDKHAFWKSRRELDDSLKELLVVIERKMLGDFLPMFGTKFENESINEAIDEFVSDSLRPFFSRSLKASVEHLSTEFLQIIAEAVLWLATDAVMKFVARRVKLCRSAQQKLQTMLQYFSDAHSFCDADDLNRSPVIFVLDNELHEIPWESLPTLQSKRVSRIPCLQLLPDLIGKWRQKRLICRESTAYVIDPEKELPATEKVFRDCFTRSCFQTWEGYIGEAPTESWLTQQLHEKDVYVYAGHGSGSCYIKTPAKSSSFVINSCCLLMGCSSGKLRRQGAGFEPRGSALDRYMATGSYCVVANLWDVTDKDIDRFLEFLIECWLGHTETNCRCVTTGKLELKRSSRYTDLLTAMTEARKVCKLRHLIGTAPVVYGLPVYVQPNK